MTMTKEEIIDRLKARSPETKKFVELGLSREHLLSPEEQKKVFGFYLELFMLKEKDQDQVSDAERIVDFLVDTYGIPRVLAAMFGKTNSELSLSFLRALRNDGTFEEADDLIKASVLLSYWDLLSAVMCITGYETLN